MSRLPEASLVGELAEAEVVDPALSQVSTVFVFIIASIVVSAEAISEVVLAVNLVGVGLGNVLNGGRGAVEVTDRVVWGEGGLTELLNFSGLGLNLSGFGVDSLSSPVGSAVEVISNVSTES